MSPWPYRFIMDVSEEELQRRREVLDLKGQYAQISALTVVGLLCILKVCGNNNSSSRHTAKTWWDKPAKSGASETRKQYAVTLLWLAWLTGISVWSAGDDYIHLTKALGQVGLSQLPFLVLLAPTSFLFASNLALPSIVSLLTSIPQTTLTAYHRLLGRFVIVPLLCGHAGFFLNFYLQVAHPVFGSLFNKRVQDQDVQYGLAATTFAILVLVFGRSRLWRLRGLLTILTVAGLTILLLRDSTPFREAPEAPFEQSLPENFEALLSPTTEDSHPIARLINDANSKFDKKRTGQSKSLKEAVQEYRRRYGMPPPPHFDKWFQFAQERGVQLIDEYDTIYNSLLPFWAVPPKVIRERARETLGFDNAVIGLLIRDGKVSLIEGGGDGYKWQREATVGMMEGFIKYLPDMDLVFNTHDEPRVVIPSEDLQRMVTYAKDVAIPANVNSGSRQKKWSPRPSDVNKGDRIEEVRTTRFNRFAHQPTWTHSRISCPVDSPARSLDEDVSDNMTSFATSDLGFIYNTSAFSDICLSPSLKSSFGFFDRPNAFDIVHDLFPVFSQSKISTFQDILYPSPWYWVNKVPYEANRDFNWGDKKDKMYWRGSTTGGFSRAGGWRRQHRQLFVKKINSPDDALVFNQIEDGRWTPKEVSRADYSHLFDVKFTFVGQCDPEDCRAQQEHFQIVESAGQQDAWAYKYLVDVDGNAFSGRYHAFLRSNSLIYKLAMFREWHDEWLDAWVHYVPLSLKGNDYVESVRYFAAEEDGKIQAPRLAKQGKEWAEKVLRNEDLEAWLFRLLLEYGRLVDDNRENLGFTL
ncbi:Beta-1,2-xylosyltransferase 1 [Talaromyces islandicus]|uniref:Beta-1,2-xylosyltransferase 1 n=1 Tax=Talaromyces islandicus TaxID=28573 RepID=A0A0U1LQX0_TALIS|nr:Beta-1,2-xylosyltransferase 1 [Talaromyces islandicus]